MANCYICGTPYARHRREVYTGKSNRVNYGRRISFGNSSYYGVRTVCSDCAKKVDQTGDFRVVFWQSVAIIILLYVYFH
jgi:hypothetical protein